MMYRIVKCCELEHTKYLDSPFRYDDGTSDHNLVIHQSAAKLSNDLLKLLVLLIHQNNHVRDTNVCNSNNPPSDFIEDQALKHKHTNLNSEITNAGYQILQNPQYCDLCWVTSNLKEGPSANVSKSQWQDWKFNPCVLHPTTPLNDDIHIQTEEKFGMVRGLVAIGLSAIRDVYTSVEQVCFDFETVLTALVEKVNAKVAKGLDRQYSGLISQVASLEDHVYCWAYELQRYHSLHLVNSFTSKTSYI